MNQKIPFIATAMAVALILASPLIHKKTMNESVDQPEIKNLIRCGSDWKALKEVPERADIPPIPDVFSHSQFSRSLLP